MALDRCYTIRIVRGTFRIRLRGEIDLVCRSDLKGIVAAYRQSAARDVLVDLGEVTFFDVTGLLLLGGLCREARLRKGRVVLRQVPPMPRRVIQVAGLGELLPDESPAPGAAVRPGFHPPSSCWSEVRLRGGRRGDC
jgi:anti-sigma B factor antagonist